jgi:predicted aspartyl protease
MSMRRRDALRWAAGASGLALAVPALNAGTVAMNSPSGTLHRLHTGDLGALVAVDASLGGRPWRCLVDSGASVALVSPAVAAREQLPVVERSRVATAGGVMHLERVELPAIEIAGRRIDAPQALVLDLARHLGEVGAAVDGLIGAPALRSRAMRLDLAAGRLQWGAMPDPAGARTTWPLRWDQGLPVIDLVLGDRDPAPFLFDTGNAGTLVVFAHQAARLAGTQGLPRATMQELGGEVTVHQALLERLEAPGYVARDVPVVFEAGDTARRGAHFDRLAGSAGLALFAAGAVTLDGPGGRLVVEQASLPQAATLPGGFGFALHSQAGQAPAVSAVFDGGPAVRAGVRPGMRLRAVDGRDLARSRADDVWRALTGVDSARFEFDALPAPVTLARERFFARWR